MRSLKELYKIGKGPSSSHTIGPEMVCQYVIRKHGKQKYRVDLFGSLALTGKGHGTDRVIKSVLGDDTVINFVPEFSKERHPNTMEVYRLAGDTCEKLLTAESVGGGSVRIDGKLYPETKEVYPQKSFDEVVKFCREYNLRLSEYASFYENGIEDYALEVWKVMKESVIRGLTTEGVISGGLNLYRKAKALYGAEAKYETAIMRENRKISAYALAVAEENADNGV
ncbi:MAG: L-serine ammonia-lyase, iron-sulfur-dependent, subunit alpha, partial [Clostridia bacterium]|nr:L-serine ammonia-lyase, iron-sulfur-dependent, subunit alpha [Clostridia bacterium]